MSKKNNYSYIGISFIILVFGIIFIPKILNRINNDEVVDKDRHNLERMGDKSASDLVTIGTVPAYSFINQDSISIASSEYLGKVYVVEFFFTTCPSICPIMNKRMVEIQNEFFGNPNFGIVPTHFLLDRNKQEQL